MPKPTASPRAARGTWPACLHAPRDEVRDVLVPINRQFPLAELLGYLREEELVSARRPVFFEYTLMEGVNDSPEDARLLPALLRGIPSKLNVQ